MLSHTHAYARSSIFVFFPFFMTNLSLQPNLYNLQVECCTAIRTCSIVSVYLISTQSHVLQSQCRQQGVNVISPITSMPFSFGLWESQPYLFGKIKCRSL